MDYHTAIKRTTIPVPFLRRLPEDVPLMKRVSQDKGRYWFFGSEKSRIQHNRQKYSPES